jgi:hypothetical protein
MLNTVIYKGTKLLPLYPRVQPGDAVIKLSEGVYSAGQILEETTLPGTYKALRTAANARLILIYDVAVDINGRHFHGLQISDETGVGDSYTEAYPDGVFKTSELKGILTGAALTTALTGANNDLIFTAIPSGAEGNAITIAYIDPAAASAALSVVVTGHAIVVNLATDGSSVITSTAAQIAAAIAASAAAAALVNVANAAANTGAGVVTALAATALSGGSDTPAGLTDDGTGDAIVAALGRLESGKNSDGILRVF